MQERQGNLTEMVTVLYVPTCRRWQFKILSFGRMGAILSPRAPELSLLTRNLCKYRDLTILTHSSVVAQAMHEVPRITVVMTSGIVRRDTVS